MSNLNRKRFNITFNMDQEDGARAYEILEKQFSKSDYVIRAILNYEDNPLLTKRDLIEVLNRYSYSSENSHSIEAEEMDDELLSMFSI